MGAGPSGLATACKLLQLAQEKGQELSVCVVEKGSEVGAHILSGAVLEPTALNELFPDWQSMGAPLTAPVVRDEMHILTSSTGGMSLPNFAIPKPMHNEGNYIVSLGNVCRWLAEQAENLGAEIFPGFAASEVLYHQDGSVKGIATGDMGVSETGEQKDSYMQGMELHAKYTVFSEGCRGHLGKQLIEKFDLDLETTSQHYGIGIKELWDIDPAKHQPGLVVHGSGWPLTKGANGGFFLYHGDNNQVTVGIIIDLSYDNPHLSPFDEFQRLKHHPVLKQHLEGGSRVSYGARAVEKGGLFALPKMSLPGALLIGCDAGTMNFAKIKGSHTAMKSGMLAAETLFEAIINGDQGKQDLLAYGEKFKQSWLHEELYKARNFGAAMHKFGMWLGGAFNWFDQNIFGGKLPVTLKDNTPDYAQLKPAAQMPKIEYPKPDGITSFDKLSSVFISGTNHEENQPCHLTLKDASLPLGINLSMWDEPAQRYCPAGVYEVLENESGDKTFQINSQNCVHCKTCDIKDPSQNITWVVPEGGGGPNYPNM
ncbi:MAG: electron transfer flavoprotein-ubiquinone oxidoreductase [Pseudomonadales bacterium]|nr:electron transfer flavoprotein-ubiquinone oxidoreductase [Pseudomonadales bacterium]